MLVRPNDRCVDEELFEIGVLTQSLGDAIPYPICFPAGKADIHRAPIAKLGRQIPPWIANACRV